MRELLLARVDTEPGYNTCTYIRFICVYVFVKSPYICMALAHLRVLNSYGVVGDAVPSIMTP